ncbi:hypothetical protein ABIE66_006004 [Peribacillus sp. B2I2]
MKMGWMACVAVIVSGVGGADIGRGLRENILF